MLSELGKVVAVEALVAFVAGVRQVHVAHSTAAQPLDGPAVVLDPRQSAQPGLALDRHHRHLARAGAGRSGTHPQHHRLPGRPLEVGVDLFGWFDGAPVDLEEILACLHIHARLGERSAQLGVPVLPAVDAPEAVAAPIDREVGAEEPGLDRRQVGLIAALHEQVPNRELAEHLLEQIVEVRAAGEPLEVGLVPLLGRHEIETMMVGVVEEVALDAPRLVVHLSPFREGIDLDFHLVELERLLLRPRRLERGADDPLLVPLVEDLLAVVREPERAGSLAHVAALVEAADALDQLVQLARVEVELVEGLARARSLGLVLGGMLHGLEQEHRPRLRHEQPAVGEWGDRQRQDPLPDPVQVDAHGLGRRLARLLRFIFLLPGRLPRSACLLLVALRGERRGPIGTQHHRVDVARHWVIELGHVDPPRRGSGVGAGGEE